MARINKAGIDYFPFDVDFFQDEKIQFTSARFGMRGEAITVRLLCKIYRNGYFMEFNDDTALLFAKGVGDGCQPTLVKDVVYELLRRGFFDKSIFERFGILTSKGIQSRYFEAAKRYKKVDVIREYLLADVSEMINVNINSINVNINSKNVYINPQKKREEIEIENKKEKDISRGGDCRAEARPVSPSDEFSLFISSFNAIRGAKFQAIKKVRTQFDARLKEGFTPAQMLQALQKAMKDKYHADTGYKYLTPEFFTRSDKIDKFLNAPEPAKKNFEEAITKMLD